MVLINVESFRGGHIHMYAPVSEDTDDEGIIDENYDLDADCSTVPREEKISLLLD